MKGEINLINTATRMIEEYKRFVFSPFIHWMIRDASSRPEKKAVIGIAL